MKPRAIIASAAALLLACTHEQPFEPGAYGPDNPPDVFGIVQQLTFDSAGDFAPNWLPGDTLISFSWQPPGTTDGDRCLALYSIAAARIHQLLCQGGDIFHDTTTLVSAGAVSPGGRVAFVTEQGLVGVVPSTFKLHVGQLGDTVLPAVLALPIQSAAGQAITGLENLSWTNDSTLVYLGTQRYPVTNDLESIPLEIGVLSVHGNGTVTTRSVPGTGGAIAVSVDRADGVAYAAFANDTLVYRLDLTGGQLTPVASFGALGHPRDISVGAHRLVAIVQGLDHVVLPSGVVLPLEQGGHLAVKNLGDTLPPVVNFVVSLVRNPTPINLDNRWYRRLVLAADGHQLLAEGYFINHNVICGSCQPVVSDTVISKQSDVFLMRLP